MKAAIYCRVSTEDQKKEDTSLQTQQSYVTTARTWASLFRCRYSYIEGRGYSLSREDSL